MFTANTMSNLSEALGMTLPLGGSALAVYVTVSASPKRPAGLPFRS